MEGLIYGDRIANGGIALPRLFLSYYAIIAAGMAIASGIALLAFRKRQRIRVVLTYICFVPVSYLLAHLCVKGFKAASYSAGRDFLMILIVTIPFYCLFLLAHAVLKRFNRLNNSNE